MFNLDLDLDRQLHYINLTKGFTQAPSLISISQVMDLWQKDESRSSERQKVRKASILAKSFLVGSREV